MYGEGERPGTTLESAVRPYRDDATILEMQDEQGHSRILRIKMESDGIMPPPMTEALLVTILKAGKPTSARSSYQPLSLINNDTKLFAKILANRLTQCLPAVVGPEQTGFVMGRPLTYNLQTFFEVVQSLDPEVQAVAIFIDIEKKSDSEAC
ncbi:hypothetical protein NDU88_003820 [Pleurodeles waltl]|uniref:Reverse transcriptase domain-containing protein n=1 Tax=Pleurodeles waltl TaxID=8319 RepID=A0AAV7RJA5_PLEWA|nr:hypothetical protein NDU88_003820 [Pleurodeles waltl]